jgi:hypothetical protein
VEIIPKDKDAAAPTAPVSNKNPSLAAHNTKSTQKRAIVQFDYAAEGENEIDLKEGEYCFSLSLSLSLHPSIHVLTVAIAQARN